MNRIILIGNGFDLAHGLKTSYADFILWYCENMIQKSLSSDSGEVKDLLCTFKKRSDYSSILSQIQNLRQDVEKSETVDKIIKKINEDRRFRDSKTPFFASIFDTLSNKGWVDIENIYYRFLFPFNEVRNSFNLSKFNYENTPGSLNDELAYIRSLLIEYLDSIQKNSVKNSIIRLEINQKLFAPIRKIDIAVSSENSWRTMLRQRVNYPKEIWGRMATAFHEDAFAISETISRFLKDQSKMGPDWIENMDVDIAPYFFFKPDRIMLVNFNYTTLADMYFPYNDLFRVNHIHGILSEPDGIIFGYGDEMDENYKRMADKNENEYLRNIKSIKYLETSNYRNLLEFIESDSFQIFIMGHSCGNSDRTMLNTLFEHENCVSIKPFYHVFEDGRDNYMELVQNISRSFTDKALMRARVVNKTFCETI